MFEDDGELGFVSDLARLPVMCRSEFEDSLVTGFTNGGPVAPHVSSAVNTHFPDAIGRQRFT